MNKVYILISVVILMVIITVVWIAMKQNNGNAMPETVMFDTPQQVLVPSNVAALQSIHNVCSTLGYTTP